MAQTKKTNLRKRAAAAPAQKSAGRPRTFGVDDIVGAALDVIVKDGYAELSMRSVAARLNTGQATLYNYFSSQRKLVEAVVDRMLMAIRPLEPGSVASLREQIIDRALAYKALNLQYPHFDAIAAHSNGYAAVRLLNSALKAMVAAGVPIERAGVAFTVITSMAEHHAQAQRMAGERREARPDRNSVSEMGAEDTDMVQLYLSSKAFKGGTPDAIFRSRLEMVMDKLLPELGNRRSK